MKTAVVTGGGTGIGKAVSLRLHAEGYEVYTLGRTLSVLESIATQMTQPDASTEARPRIIPLSVDVTDEASFRKAVATIERIDVLVVNAGICKQSFLNSPDATDVWNSVIQTNLTGAWLTMKILHNRLATGAKVVFVSSGLGKLGRAGYSAYAASKHGLLGMMKCFALELAPRQINVNAVCPGWVDTQMSKQDLKTTATQKNMTVKDVMRDAMAAIPIARFVHPDEVAALILWLCGNQSNAITGQSYNISGGEFGL